MGLGSSMKLQSNYIRRWAKKKAAAGAAAQGLDLGNAIQGQLPREYGCGGGCWQLL
jgi:hypothetical protein